MITITDRAAKEIKKVIDEQENKEEQHYLRIRVVGSGCSGFSNKLDIDTICDEKKDNKFEVNGIQVVIDKRSILYLEGASIDFLDDLNKRGFLISNPASKGSCGCGQSYSM